MSTTRRPYISTTLRRQVRERAGGRCEYCQCPETFSLDTFSIDHVLPFRDDGPTTLANLAFACNNCNLRKADASEILDPDTGQFVTLYNPRIHLWNEHFTWSEDTLTILPRTTIGRVTETRLQLNRQGAINIRRALLSLGEPHPPVETLAPHE